MFIRLGLAAAIVFGLAGAAFAAPSRIVILRNGEKADDWKLCAVGEQRAQALKLNYLGRDAAKSLFEEDEPPAFFFATPFASFAMIGCGRCVVKLSLSQNGSDENNGGLHRNISTVAGRIAGEE